MALNITRNWHFESLVSSFSSWRVVVPHFKTLHCFVLWNIWLHKNKIIFETGVPDSQRVTWATNGSFKEWHGSPKPPLKCRQLLPQVFSSEAPIGYFDGASQEGEKGRSKWSFGVKA